MPQDTRTARHKAEQDKPYNLYQALKDAIKETQLASDAQLVLLLYFN